MEKKVVCSRLQEPPPIFCHTPLLPHRWVCRCGALKIKLELEVLHFPCQIQLACDRGPKTKNKNKREQHTPKGFSENADTLAFCLLFVTVDFLFTGLSLQNEAIYVYFINTIQ